MIWLCRLPVAASVHVSCTEAVVKWHIEACRFSWKQSYLTVILGMLGCLEFIVALLLDFFFFFWLVDRVKLLLCYCNFFFFFFFFCELIVMLVCGCFVCWKS